MKTLNRVHVRMHVHQQHEVMQFKNNLDGCTFTPLQSLRVFKKYYLLS